MKKLLITTLFIISTSAQADTLLIDAINTEPENTPNGLLRPVRGNSKQIVVIRFGPAEHETGSIGTPAISRWDYQGYSVYFENNLVLDTVITR